VGDAASAVFAIKNTTSSNYKLLLLSYPSVFVSGDAADFTILKDTLRTSIQGDNLPVTGFSILFTPQSGGNKTATIFIASNDGTTPIYKFTVIGTAEVVATNIATPESNKLLISSNPASENFTLKYPGAKEGSRVCVTDLTGKIIYESIYKEEMLINLPNAHGLYLLSVQNEEEYVVRKIVME
jgi:hypothetical protein